MGPGYAAANLRMIRTAKAIALGLPDSTHSFCVLSCLLELQDLQHISAFLIESRPPLVQGMM
jgi:hypothetical protein